MKATPQDETGVAAAESPHHRLAACEAERDRLADWFAGATGSALSAIYILEPETDASGEVVDFRFVFANRRGAALLQLHDRDLRELRLTEVLPPSRKAIVPEQCRAVMASGDGLAEEFEVPEFPPEARWIRHQVVAIRNGVVITSENISDRRRAEAEMQQREEWFRAAAEGNLNALYIEEAVRDEAGKVVDFRFVHVNEQGGRLVGMSPADMVGQSICELFPVNRTHGYFERYREVFELRRTVVDEFPISIPGMRARWLRQLAMPWSRGVVLSAEDITEEIERKRELEQRQKTLMAFLEHIPGPAWIADPDGMIRIYNDHFARLAPPGVLVGGKPAPLDAIFGPTLGAIYRANNAQVLATRAALHTVEQGPREDGLTGTYDVHKFPLGSGPDALVGGFAIDVTERERLLRQANLLGAIAKESHDAIFAVSQTGDIVEWSPSAERLYGWCAADVLGLPGTQLMAGDSHERCHAMLADALAGRAVARAPASCQCASGRKMEVELTMAPFQVAEGGERWVAVLATDVSARREAEARADYLASHDAATGRLNREGFLRAMGERIGGAGQLAAVARISLREAEPLRELLGTEVVDALVRAFAERIETLFAGDDALVARDGPDQLLLALGGGEQAAGRLLATWPLLIGSVEHEQQLYSLSPRMGYALADAALPMAELLRCCDIAHGVALSQHTTEPVAYLPSMAGQLARRVAIQRELAGAIRADQLSLVFQPILRDGDGLDVVGLEALLRWTSPALGVVSPGEFIPVAEESSLIVELGDWVVETACTALHRLEASAGQRLYVAVNVAEAQLARQDFVDRVEAVLRATGLEPAQLEMEITERTLMADSAVHQANLEALRRLGVRLSVDDFGTGYSSLAYLMRFSVDKIKIDRSFVSSLESSGGNPAVVRAMIALADALGVACVSEGVETESQLARLRQLGCRQFQGYLLGKPMPPPALADWLASREPRSR